MGGDASGREAGQGGGAAYRFEARDLVAAGRCHFRARFWRAQTLLALALAVIGLALALWALGGGRGGFGAVLLGGLLGVLAGPWAVLRWEIPRRAARFVARSPVWWDEVALAWDAEGLRVAASGAESRMPWGHYARWLESDEVVLLCLTDRSYQMIPKRALGPGDLAALRALAAAGGVAGAALTPPARS